MDAQDLMCAKVVWPYQSCFMTSGSEKETRVSSVLIGLFILII